MLTDVEAKAAVERANPGSKAQVCVRYKDIYLVRVKHHDPEEADYDPFYSVNPTTGEVNEFSVITDGDPVEIMELFV